MWQMIKEELRYNLDIIIGFFCLYFLFFCFLYLLGTGYLGQDRMGADWIAYFVLGAGIFLPFNIKLRWHREKRDRIHQMLPFSLRRISIARFFVFFVGLMAIVLCSLTLYILFHSLVPNTSTSLLSIFAMTGFAMVFNAIYYFLVPDLKGFADADNKFLAIPVCVLYKVFQVFFICIGIVVGLLAFLLVQIGENFHGRGNFSRLMVNLYKGIFQSPFWTIVFLAFSFFLFFLAILVFENRKSYVE
ncbi:MAG: hypothetical protein KAU46_04820 [Candidatus Aminicenantes bacterium]|nr:hypothetical protein [Candidatus Aminicenantes bacterium]